MPQANGAVHVRYEYRRDTSRPPLLIFSKFPVAIGGNSLSMTFRLFSVSAVLFLLSIAAFAAAKPAATTANIPAWEQPQPAVERIDLLMYGRIREEGLQHSHIMEY